MVGGADGTPYDAAIYRSFLNQVVESIYGTHPSLRWTWWSTCDSTSATSRPATRSLLRWTRTRCWQNSWE